MNASDSQSVLERVAQRKRSRSKTTAEKNRERIAVLLADGYTHRQTARRLGLSEFWVRRFFPAGESKKLRGVTPIRYEAPPDGEGSRYTPTPAEIAMACEEIQKGWTPQERGKRSKLLLDAQKWEVPVVSLAEMEP